MSATDSVPPSAPKKTERGKVVVHVSPGHRADVVDEIDSIADHLLVVHGAVIALEEAPHYGAMSHEAVRAVLRGIIERVERLKESV